ncbi:hypothetical protein GCM10023115_18890 [Pontixanthobacter gangjinensis]|uniref:Uncharacterized protein n=1 Tax=Pontixanthobacter gangjinensis TaxID=1028742 RepID=A0A6I4SQK8_9SPHN|nr:hypothetical protein [Pontixanthobacter gangjinensis]MXO57137.1 hypothetical protein [Pontixanthobacter gangjinensis]
MAKRSSLIIVDAKMYKHFAIVTVALTGGMALLADGEKREAVAQGVETIATYEPEKTKTDELIINNDRINSGSGDLGGFYESGGGGGIGGENIHSGFNPDDLSLADTGFRVDNYMLAQLGLTQAQFDALSPAEREAAMVKMNNGVTAAQRQKQIEVAGAASLARSGGTESADY